MQQQRRSEDRLAVCGMQSVSDRNNARYTDRQTLKISLGYGKVTCCCMQHLNTAVQTTGMLVRGTNATKSCQNAPSNCKMSCVGLYIA